MEVVDLFSGVGGLGLGFSLTGFAIEAAVDVDQRRASAYGRNIKPRRVIASDVRGIDFFPIQGR